MKKWILVTFGAVAAIVVAVYAVGARLPRDHLASVRAHFHQPPDSIYHALVEVAAYPTWRAEVKRVQRLPDRDGRLTWRETASFGVVDFSATVTAPPNRLVTTIVSTGAGFGGRWIYRILPDSVGATVSITEEGTVDNPFFRFLSRYVFGLHASMEGLLRALGGRFHETVVPERTS